MPSPNPLPTPIEVAYLGVEVTDPEALDTVLADVAGLTPGPTPHTWRNDERAHRLLVTNGPANDATVVGFEVADADAAAAVARRLTDLGYATDIGTTEYPCRFCKWRPSGRPGVAPVERPTVPSRGMSVGLLSLGDLITDPVTGQRRTAAERHRNLVDQAVLAERSGFASIHLGEHHFCEYILSSPAVVLAAIAERTSTLRLSTGVTLGVNLDPVRVAEDYATVDVLSGGRVEPVIGRGTFFPHTFAGFGQDPAHARAVFAEHLEILVRLWTDDEVTWSGEHHCPLDRITTHPRPLQRPCPPIWVGGGSSMASVDLAARLGLGLMLPSVFGTPASFVPAVERYEEQWEAHGHDPAARRVGCVSHAHVGPTTAIARRAWEPRYRAYIEWVNDLVRRSTDGASRGLGGFDFEFLCANTALCGSPAEVVDRMGHLRELLHLDTHLLMFDMGGIPDDELFATIKLFAAEALRDAVV